MTEADYWARPPSATGSTGLYDHLDETREVALELTDCPAVFSEVAEVTTFLHDFAKLTEFFQTYIRRVAETRPGERPQLTYQERRQKQHARLSAYAVEYALMKREIAPEWRVYAFFAVLKHHQSLPNISEGIDRTINLQQQKNQQRFTLVQEQLKNIYQHARPVANSLLDEATDGAGSMTEFAGYLKNKRTHATLSQHTANAVTYSRTLHVWGVLTAADKLASAGLTLNSPPPPQPETITKHIDQLPTFTDELRQQLNERRETARKGALESISDFEAADTAVGTITLPTGFGKTLTGLQTALSLADDESRVIYALPYTSIIDQVDEVIRDIFDVAPTDPEYTIHHHLAETRTIPSGKIVDTDAAELLAETWQAPLVLTTFVQLFESVAGPTNRESVKLPALENAVIVLDEPQALPKKWWHFVTWALDFLTEEFNATVILMTATQPRLLKKLSYTADPYPLITNSQSHFEFLSDNPRVQYSLDESMRSYLVDQRNATPLPITDAATQVVTDQATSVLAVGNTVASVTELGKQVRSSLETARSLNSLLQELYQDRVSAEAHIEELSQTLVDRARSYDEPIVSTLTSYLRPIDRRILLRAIRRLLETDTPLYVTATQLIEAGVDVSFDRLYRDFAPLSSLIQAAGRCNREFGGETAEVTIWRLASPEHDTPPSELIYGDGYDLLIPTASTLRNIHDNGEISEYEMAETGARQYFETLHERIKPGDRSLVEDGQRAKFDALQRESLIADEYDQIEVYVPLTPNEQALIDAYEVFEHNGRYDRLQSLRSVLQTRQISLPERERYLSLPNLRPVPGMEDAYYLDTSNSKSSYQIENGGGLTTDTT